jgi:tetratricopeptide (TPR) repeat protein
LAGSAATATAVAQATVAAGPTATAAALEAHYQKGLGYMNIGRWQEARAELEQVFAVNPNYNDVQAKLKEAEAKLTQLSPTIIPTRRVVAATVQANGEWQNSGVTVQAGQRITLAASGRWSHGQSNYGPEGYDKYDNSAVLPSAKIGSLIGRIGSGRPFLIGTSLSLTANDDGVLQLSMNDAVGTFGDNDGSVTAQIDVQ